MLEPFKGWRRKLGVRCAGDGVRPDVVAWRWSNTAQETLYFQFAYQGQVLNSTPGCADWRTIPASQVKSSRWPQWHRSLPDSFSYDGVRVRPANAPFSRTRYHRQPVRGMAFRYWPLTILLTLFSACLILWKPRKKSSPNQRVNTQSRSPFPPRSICGLQANLASAAIEFDWWTAGLWSTAGYSLPRTQKDLRSSPQVLYSQVIAQDRNRTCTGVTPLGPQPVFGALVKCWS